MTNRMNDLYEVVEKIRKEKSEGSPQSLLKSIIDIEADSFENREYARKKLEYIIELFLKEGEGKNDDSQQHNIG